MKTLNEVIKAVHHCGLLSSFDDTYEYDGGCPYEVCSKCEQKRMLGKDIVRYLEAYCDDKDDLTALRAYWAEQQANPALTWEDLKQMFHKPVWLETKTKKGWVIINDFEAVTPNSENVNVIHTSHKGAKCSHFQKHLMGRTWQAYKKERR